VKYRDIIGYSSKQPKKKVVKEQPKPTVTDILKEEFGDTINEGPAYEYEKMVKSIDKLENKQAKEVNNLVKTLQKKGFKKEATNVANSYMKSMRKFKNELDDIIRGLM
jgi:predicted patatin/cPLA2 family phospholipase